MVQTVVRIGRYEINSLIADGGMGSLYLARDTNPNTHRLVALKLLLANLDSGDLRERFSREARALSALNHPNIVNIYDSGEFQRSQIGQLHHSPFIVMEYVRGETLAEKIKRRATMNVAQKLRLMVELCSGLHHAHDAGIIHRDIKPANLMVDLEGRLKILDFGIARVSEGLTRLGIQVTQVNMRIGTPGYMSPEQIEGGDIDPRSDVFATGAVAYELLTYREAFTGANTRQIETAVLKAQPAPLTSVIADVDPELEQVVSRALAKDPDARYQDAAALGEAFERLIWRLGPSATPTPKPRLTPNPVRTPHDSRAEVAFQRCVAMDAEGAHGAARRFAMEAIAEDPHHERARGFMSRVEPGWATRFVSGDVHRSAGLQPNATPTGTVLRTENQPAGLDGTYVEEGAAYDVVDAVRTPNRADVSVAETVLSDSRGSGTARSSRKESRADEPRRRFEKVYVIGGIVATILVVVAIALVLWRSLSQPGPTLTIIPPKGGTITGPGINCGTGGSECSIELTKNDPVYLSADPDEGFTFGGYTLDCKRGGRTVMTGSRTCGATFHESPKPVPVEMMELQVDKPLGGTLWGKGIKCGAGGDDCSEQYPLGETVRLMQAAENDYAFKGFLGDCKTTTGQVILSQARRCGAMFVREPKRITKIDPRPTPPPTPPPTPLPTHQPDSASDTPDPLKDKKSAGNVNEKPEEDEKDVELPGSKVDLPSPRVMAEKEIVDLLESYRKAYEQRDVEGISRLYPNAPIKALRYAFQEYKSLEYTFTAKPDFVDLDYALGTAKVKIPSTSKPEYKGPGQPPQDQINLFTLKRSSRIWIIESLTYLKK